MNKTKIEWVQNPDGSQGYTHNPMSGCENHTPEGLCLDGLFPCYAYKLAHGRLKERYRANHNIAPLSTGGYPEGDTYADPFYPRFWEERMSCQFSTRTQQGIFVCDMGDLFGVGIPEQWTRRVIQLIKGYPQHRFYLLTKQPQNLIKWSPFPKNCWVGVTATNRKALLELSSVFGNPINTSGAIRANIKFISFEPLLEPVICQHDFVDTTVRRGFRDRIMPQIVCSKCGRGKAWGDHNNEFIGSNGKPIVDWLIIGACTGSASSIGKVQRRYPDLVHKPIGNKWTAQPPIEWLREIVGAADKAGVKVFLKDNLRPLLHDHSEFFDDVPQGAHPNYESIAMLRQEMPGEVKHADQ